jgi:membrane-associated phospholipid phosphatase
VPNFTWIAAVVATTTAAIAPHQTPPPPPDRNPFIYVAHNLGRDLRDFAGLETLVILGGGGAAAIVAGRSDDRVDRWTLKSPIPSWTAIGRVGGDGWMQGAIAAGTWAAGTVLEHPLTTHVGNDLIRAQMLNMVTTRALKIAVNRRRPSGGGHALPSGHASATFTTAGVVHRHFGWKAGVPAYAAASFVGLTRVRDRSHWVSDTVFGAAMGVAAAWTVTRGHDNQRWTITPVAVPGGGGVLVVRR